MLRWMTRFRFALLLLLLALPACGRPKMDSGVAVPDVTVSLPVQRAVTDYLEYIGNTDAVETVAVKARATGYLTQVNFTAGADVKGGEQLAVSAARIIGMMASPVAQSHVLTTSTLIPDQGDVLFVVDPRPYQADYDRANGQVILSEAKLDLANANLARAKELQKTPGAISQKEYDTYVASQKEANAEVIASKANLEVYRLNLSFTKVRAAIDGKVSRNYLTVGNMVTKDETLLTTVVSEDPMYGYFNPDERAFLAVQEARRTGRLALLQLGEIPVEMGLANEVGYPHKGYLDFVNNQLDKLTGTITLRGVFPNPREHVLPPGPDYLPSVASVISGAVTLPSSPFPCLGTVYAQSQYAPRKLTPGLFVRIRVPIGDPHPALLVIDRAIGTDQGLKYVYTVDAQNKVHYRRVTLGPLQDDGLRVISSGLEKNERVLIDGLQLVRSDMEVKPRVIEMPTATQDVAPPPK